MSTEPQHQLLESGHIISTAELLRRRITERFPDSGLRILADDVCIVSHKAVARTEEIGRPNLWLRLLVVVLIAGLLAVLVPLGVYLFEGMATEANAGSVEDKIQALEAALGSAVFIGAAVIYLLSLERRWKRERLLEAMRELRALAHIVDMHQLTKDPETTTRAQPTPSSPKRTLDTFQLSRYLDYCSELLSLISKIGAIYVQEFPDPDALEAADQLANLTNGLTRNIWQKIMILDRAVEPGRG